MNTDDVQVKVLSLSSNCPCWCLIAVININGININGKWKSISNLVILHRESWYEQFNNFISTSLLVSVTVYDLSVFNRQIIKVEFGICFLILLMHLWNVFMILLLIVANQMNLYDYQTWFNFNEFNIIMIYQCYMCVDFQYFQICAVVIMYLMITHS